MNRGVIAEIRNVPVPTKSRWNELGHGGMFPTNKNLGKQGGERDCAKNQ
jgi:hypothetical protein